MTEQDLQQSLTRGNAAAWRIALARRVESRRVQHIVIAVIVLNAVILGLEATPLVHSPVGPWLPWVDGFCLAFFVVELACKAAAYRWAMLRNAWNLFDIAVVGIALLPAAGPASVLRSLRVLRLFRLLNAVPSLRKVVAAFLHAIPGLSSVIGLMGLFMFVAAVMATGLFGHSHPEWFGHLGRSLFTLFQIMTLESWSMGIVRPVLVEHPWAWMFFVPFIIFATFTVLNLFIGIIVSTMQEISTDARPPGGDADSAETAPATAAQLARVEAELAAIRAGLDRLQAASGESPCGRVE